MTKALRIDHRLCWGCRVCEVACKQEHNTPEGIHRITVSEKWSKSSSGQPNFTFRVHLCRQCDKPPCVPACPESAMAKDAETGVVLID